MRGIILINGFQSTQISLPMDAYGAALGLAASVADMFYGKIAEKYGVYIELVILMCVNPSAALELIGEFLLVNANQIYNLLDEQCYLYTGLHVVEIYNLCAKGIEMYNEYKRKKREKKKDREENNPDKPKAANIKSTGIGVSVEVEPDVILENMYNWLWEQNDALFNGFIVLQFLDAVRSIQDMIKMFTEVDVDTLDDNIETMEDFIRLCEEIGLDDDSTAIDLSLIPSLNINVIQSSLNSLKNQFTEMTSFDKLTSLATGSLALGSSVNVGKTYEIETDTETKTIHLMFYDEPVKPSISKKVYKAFSKAKDADDKPLFSSSELKALQETINETYQRNPESGSGEITINGYTVKIRLNIKTEPEKSKQEEFPVRNRPDNDAPVLEIRTITEEYMTEQQMDKYDKRKRRSTIKVLHTAYSILKSLVPKLTELAKLIRNYRINKEYVKSQQRSNLYLMFEAAMYLRGLVKKVSGDSSSTLYTVRTLELYEYINTGLDGIDTGGMTSEISYSQAKNINSWLNTFDKSASKIDLSKDKIILFFDHDTLKELQAEKERLKNQYGLSDNLIGKLSSRPNGSLSGISKIEINGNDILYSDSILPLNSSEIIEQMSKTKR